jgi:lipopolysaccharide export system protein LptA
MRWQKPVRLALAVFVVAFAIIVTLALRRGKDVVPNAPVERQNPAATTETRGGGNFQRGEAGKTPLSLKWGGNHFTFADGRSKFDGGIELKSQRGERKFTVTSKEAEVLYKDKAVQSGKFMHDVKLTTDDDLSVAAAEATYDDADGIVRVPGPVEFSKGRMKGTGVGATYDQNTQVLWLLDKAHISVAPDAKGGGAVEADAKSAGLARADHYARLTGDARLDAQGRILRGDDVIIKFTEDDEHVQSIEQRGHSRIDGGAGGPQSMAANDIDLTYAEDGRSLQFAKLMENASVQLAGTGKTPGRKVTGRNIDIALAPDGKTVTNLTGSERVQVDLPPEGDMPSRRITADTLVAAGTPDGGLQEATFAGNAVYRETRAARKNLAAVNRLARSQRLVVKTKPGFGAIEQAEFRGNFNFTDGAQQKAEAPHAIYYVEKDAIDLAPSEDPGQGPMVSDGKVEVTAKTIQFTISGRQLKADTAVRTSMQPQKKADGEATKLPSVLKQDETVFITSNRLEYDGAASRAVYVGNATLWQDKDNTSIRADTITIDNSKGNLTAKEKVVTVMIVEHEDSKTKERKRVQQKGEGDAFEYDDEKRLVAYTANARVTGPQGDLKAERILMFLKPKVNELDRVEAFEKVTLKEGVRLVQGPKLVYTSADDRYVITGPPVLIIEEQPKCGEMTAHSAIYERAKNTMVASAPGTGTKSVPCTGKRLY